MLGRYPVDSTLDRTPLASSRLRCRIISTLDLYDIAFSILYYLLALYDVCVLETYLSVRLETEVLLRRLFHEVVSLDIYLAGERNLA